MITIKGNDIHLTRGDSAYLNVEIHNNQGIPYKAQDGDLLTITVRHYIKDNIIFTKTVDAGTVIVIEPKDTVDNDIGRYKYDIQLNTPTGEIFTVIPKSNFYLEEEVTYHE